MTPYYYCLLAVAISKCTVRFLKVFFHVLRGCVVFHLVARECHLYWLVFLHPPFHKHTLPQLTSYVPLCKKKEFDSFIILYCFILWQTDCYVIVFDGVNLYMHTIEGNSFNIHVYHLVAKTSNEIEFVTSGYIFHCLFNFFFLSLNLRQQIKVSHRQWHHQAPPPLRTATI